MKNHSQALVPTECWSYSSPNLRLEGKEIDIGLICESLLYYDVVHINFTNANHLAAFLRWLISQEQLSAFLSLLEDGSIRCYDYAFLSAAINDPSRGTHFLMNIQDTIQEQPETFEQRFLYHNAIDNLLPKARHRQKLYNSFRGHVTEAKSAEFGKAIKNAQADILNPKRCALIVQKFVDEVYQYKSLGPPPEVIATITENLSKKGHDINWNIDFSSLSDQAGKILNFGPSTPLTAAAHANRLLWSAAKLHSDLYLGSPMSGLVGDKLYESAQKITKTSKLIDQFQHEVEFPDVRSLVNIGFLRFDEILRIRKRAKRFRIWLQQEGDRDRNAIYAYHTEVSRESGFTDGGRKLFKFFGAIGGGAIGGVVGSAVAGPLGAAVGGASGSGLSFLIDLASELRGDWKPVVFGNWLQNHIQKLVTEQKEDA